MNNEINIISKVLISSTVTVSFLFSSIDFSASAHSEENDSAVNKQEYRDNYMQQDEKEALIENLKKHKVKPDKISFIDKNWNKLSKNEIYEYVVDGNNKEEISNKVQTGYKQTNSQKTSNFSSSKNRIATYSSTSVVKITKDQLLNLGWKGKLDDEELNHINSVLNQYHIDTPNKIAHFFSQVMAESGNGVYTYELGDASYLSYLDYMLGNNGPGQGAFYRGAGYLQLTGKNNYRSFGTYINDSHVLTNGYSYVSKNYAWESAAWFYSIHSNANNLAANGASVEEITRSINGGYNALEKRKAAYQKAKSIFNSNNIYPSLSDTKYNPLSKVSDWMKTDSGVTFRYENGIFNVTKKDGVAVYGEPTNDGKLLGRLKLNDEVTYDYKYVNDGYIWISYEKNNKRYYAQVGYSDNHISFKPQTQPFGHFNKVNIGDLSYSDTIYNKNATLGNWGKTNSNITFRKEMGRFKVTKDNGVAIYGEPNNDGKQFDTLKKNQYLIYDYKYVNDGYVWVGFEKNGKRYYAQVGYSDEQNNYKPGTEIFGVFF